MKKGPRISVFMLVVVLIMSGLLSGCKHEVQEESNIEVEMEDEETKLLVNKEMETSSSSVVNEESVESSLEESSKVEEVNEKGPINPLTGETTDIDYSKMRPYVYMCNDIEVSMPQCGVSEADIIMEMMDESGVTRFMVWFMDPSGVEKIGSIRSARIYNVETAAGYDAFLVHCGGSDEALTKINNTGLHDLDAIYGEYGTFWRDPERQSYGIEHSMFANGDNSIEAIVDIKGYDQYHEEGYDGTYGMVFSENAVNQCNDKAETIHVAYAGWKTTDFVYDAAAGGYTMYQYGTEYTDDGDGGFFFANVINMYAETRLQGDGVHLTITLDEGEGTYFTGGKAISIKWYKDGYEDCFHFTLEDGTPLQFSIGSTFICVNQCGDYSYQGECTWE